MNRLLVHILILVVFRLNAQVSTSGCYLSGAMLDPNSTAGCGNSTNYCNLASLYVPLFSPTACGTSVVTGGVTHSKSTSIILPAGCTATVEAEFRKRNYFSSPVNPSGSGCSNSGMDSSPDALSITQSGGVVSSQGSIIDVNVGTCGAYPTLGTYTSASSVLSAGCSNADGYVFMITSGGTVTIGGSSNRADEIITFTLNFSGTCGANCDNVLPVTLSSFSGLVSEGQILLNWQVLTEHNVKHYSVEKSLNGVDFTEIVRVYPLSAATGKQNIHYSALDVSPAKGVNYYRVTNHDNDGSSQTSNVIYVLFDQSLGDELTVIQNNETFEILFARPANRFSLYDISGREIIRRQITASNKISISKDDIAPGLYLIGTESSSSIKKVLIY